MIRMFPPLRLSERSRTILGDCRWMKQMAARIAYSSRENWKDWTCLTRPGSTPPCAACGRLARRDHERCRVQDVQYSTISYGS